MLRNENSIISSLISGKTIKENMHLKNQKMTIEDYKFFTTNSNIIHS